MKQNSFFEKVLTIGFIAFITSGIISCTAEEQGLLAGEGGLAALLGLAGKGESASSKPILNVTVTWDNNSDSAHTLTTPGAQTLSNNASYNFKFPNNPASDCSGTFCHIENFYITNDAAISINPQISISGSTKITKTQDPASPLSPGSTTYFALTYTTGVATENEQSAVTISTDVATEGEFTFTAVGTGQNV